MSDDIRQKINKYLDENVKQGCSWTEYERHKTAMFSLVVAYPEDFEYAMQEIVRRMCL